MVTKSWRRSWAARLPPSGSFARDAIFAGVVFKALQYLYKMRARSSEVPVFLSPSLTCHRATSGSARIERHAAVRMFAFVSSPVVADMGVVWSADYKSISEEDAMDRGGFEPTASTMPR